MYMMKIFFEKFELIMRFGITIIFGVLILYLFFLAGFSTSLMDLEEHSYLVDDSVILNLVYLLGFIFILVFVSLICGKKT